MMMMTTKVLDLKRKKLKQTQNKETEFVEGKDKKIKKNNFS